MNETEFTIAVIDLQKKLKELIDKENTWENFPFSLKIEHDSISIVKNTDIYGIRNDYIENINQFSNILTELFNRISENLKTKELGLVLKNMKDNDDYNLLYSIFNPTYELIDLTAWNRIEIIDSNLSVWYENKNIKTNTITVNIFNINSFGKKIEPIVELLFDLWTVSSKLAYKIHMLDKSL